MSFELLQGECLDHLRTMPDVSIDAIVTDPPAGISFMGKGWDGDKGGRDRWIEWLTEVMAEALRVCKPGAHALVWAIPRTSHWTAMALEDAGWEVRDRIAHHFGTGFPKSHNLKGEQQGKGTALKPSTEDWWLCRKPLVGTVLANVSEYGTGALNIDACKIAHQTVNGGNLADNPHLRESIKNTSSTFGADGELAQDPSGRWPANLVLSHHEDCEPLGTKRVKKAGTRAGAASDNAGEHGTGDGSTYLTRKPSGAHYGDEDGTETVEAWNCVPGCPVAEMDAQSGVLHGHGSTHHSGSDRGVFDWGTAHRPQAGGENGGASRFFFTTQTNSGEETVALCDASAAKSSSSQPERAADSVPSGAATEVSRGDRPRSDSTPPTTSETPSGSRQSGESDMQPTPSTAGESSPGTRPARPTPTSSPANGAVDPTPTDTTTTTTNQPRSGGSAEGATLPNTLRSTAPGARASSLPIDSDDGARFRYGAKTSRAERNAGLEGFEKKAVNWLQDDGRSKPKPLSDPRMDRPQKRRPSANGHPTVKPINLMRWLVRLVTPPGGTVLDPFLGSGSTGCAAVLEGFDFIGIEREPEYVEIAEARISFWAQHEGREVGDVLKAHRKHLAKREQEAAQTELLEAAA